MRHISFADSKGRDAVVCIENCFHSKKEKTNEDSNNYQYIKSTVQTSQSAIFANNDNDELKVALDLIKNDPEVDIVNEGRIIKKRNQLFLTQNNEAAYDIAFEEHILNSDGSLRENRPYQKVEPNIQSETFPIRCSKLSIPIYEAARRYVLSQHYQLYHTNGLTFDFLYDVAKELWEKKEMCFVGGGPEGLDPIVLVKGGKHYRGFLSGRVFNKSYVLILHLTEIDLEDCV